jgi:ligand-binding sensor domain-containing protein/signal transduction histidine kinase
MRPAVVPFASLSLGHCLLLGAVFSGLASETSQSATNGASDYLIHVWRSEDGLPQNSVNCLAQTPDGYLWIGTRSGGLARFDGNRFVVFNPETTPELEDVEFETLSVDSRGTLWIAAGNESAASMTAGKFRLVRERTAQPRWHPLNLVAEDSDGVFLSSFHPAVFRIPRSGRVNEAQPVELNPPPPLPLPAPITQSGDGALWYITDRHDVARLQYSAPSNKNVTIFKLDSPAQVLGKDSAGELWLATDQRLGVVTQHGFAEREPTNGPAPRGVRNIIASPRGGLWVWDGQLLRKMSGNRWTVSATGFQPSPSVKSLRFYADSQGGLWIIEYGAGLWNVRPDGLAVLLTLQDGLPSKFVVCWLEDSEGNIWIGTKEAGLARIRRRQFKQFTAADGIPGDVAQSVCEDAQNTIWVGTANGGLARQDGDRFLPVPLTPRPDPLIESVTVFPDATNGIWIGTLQGSVFRYTDGEVRCVNNEVTWDFPMERLRDHVANVIMQDSRGRVWFCNGSGAYYYDKGKLTVFGNDRGFVENIGVRAVAEGPPGTLWFGAEPGDLWEVVNDAPVRHHPPAQWPMARVSALLPDADGSIWVGTLGGGLLRFDHGTFTRVTMDQGLPDSSITQLLEDGQGHLWGGTYAGIFRASKEALKRLAAGETNDSAFSVFGHFDGLPAQAYSGWFQPSCWRSHDGRLWFTTVKGLVAVNPRDVAINQQAPPVVIEEMLVDGSPVAFKSGHKTPDPMGANSPTRISPGRHYVEFRFTGINFTAPDKVRLKWQLEGVENHWREGVNQRSAGYGPLPPGAYRFSVFAANSDGIWNEQGAAAGFIVLPYFWETWWFQAFFIASMCSALILSVTFRLRRAHRAELERLARTHEMERERARIARDLHDDLGTSLTQISLLSSLLEREGLPSSDLRSLTQQIRGTSRAMVTALNEIVWAVNPKNDSLNELVGYLGNLAEAFFRSGPIRCRLDIPSEVPERSVASEIRHGVFLAFKEAINNVAKHSRATEVRVKVICEEDKLRVAVEDNGVGFDPVAKQPGNGLANISQRLEKMGGSCNLSSTAGGTTVLFQLNLR